MEHTVKSGPKELKSFALVMAIAIGGVFGTAIPLWKRGQVTPMLLVIGALFLAFGFIAPKALKPLYLAWMKIGEALGWVNSRIILGAIFYLMFFPIGMLMRLAGRDPMARKFDKKSVSYRVLPSYDKDLSSGMERPF